MRIDRVAVVLGLSACLSACSSSWSQEPASLTWETGFWLWQGTYHPASSSVEPLDAIFAEAGSIRPATPLNVGSPGTPATKWEVSGFLPENLPLAKKYWIVFRCEKQDIPDLAFVPKFADIAQLVLRDASARRIDVEGIQLDIDSPTSRLDEYATFLRSVRKALPQGVKLSITALLDWFRPRTAISQVIREVDEFVPQFYDIDRESYDRGGSIAAKIDAARWSEVFNRFGKPYRVGICTFGRSRYLPGKQSVNSAFYRAMSFRDLAPLDFATNRAFRLDTAQSPAGELVLNYRATTNVHLGYNDFAPGDNVQFVLPTPETVREAVKGVRAMNGNIAGVVFFRWPSDGESLTMEPEEVMTAAGLSVSNGPVGSRIELINGRCAAVTCVDLYLRSRTPFSSKELRYRIHSSVPFEYFLPEQSVPTELRPPSELQVSLPPYCARGRLYLGRAVTSRASTFTLDEEL